MGNGEGQKNGNGDERVNVVDTNKIILDEYLPLFWSRDRQVGFPLQNFDTACFFDEDAFHCFG
jgi:hypothetical protein